MNSSQGMKFPSWKQYFRSRKKPLEDLSTPLEDLDLRLSQSTIKAPGPIRSYGHDLRISLEIEERLQKDLALKIDQIPLDFPDSLSSIDSPSSSIFAYPTRPVRTVLRLCHRLILICAGRKCQWSCQYACTATGYFRLGQISGRTAHKQKRIKDHEAVLF